MKELNKKHLLPALFFFFFTITIFWQFFLKGLHPFPGDYLIAWFEPWKSENFIDGKILIPHKPIAEDVFRQVYPFRTLAIDMMKKLEAPLWNPYNGAGMPLLAAINNGFFDPFNFLFFLFPYYFAWSAYIIIQYFLIGYITFIYCRKISLSFKSSILSSIIFLLSGFVTVRIIYEVYGLAIALFPLILYLIECYIQKRNSKSIYFLPLAIFALIVSTQPQLALYFVLFSAAYFIFRITTYAKFNIKDFAIFGILIILGFGLSSVQLFPAIELSKFSNINHSASTFIIDRFLLPVKHLITIFIPNYFGNSSTYNYWGYGDFIQTAAYIGLIPCFLAFFGLINKKINSFQKFFLTAIIISLLLVIDWIGSRIIFSLPIPIISTEAPSRIFVISTFCISILAGFGLEKLVSIRKISKSIFYILAIFLVPVFGILMYTYLHKPIEEACLSGIIQNCRNIALRNSLLEIIAFFVFVSFFLFYLVNKKETLKNLSLLFIFAIISILGIYNSNKYLPFSKKETFFPQNQLINTLEEKTTDGRVFGMGEANIQSNFASYFRFYDPQYYHPLYIVRYREFIEYANNGKLDLNLPRGDVQIANGTSANKSLETRRERLFELLNVKYLIFKKKEVPEKNKNEVIGENSIWYIKENKASLPRVYLVNNLEYIQEKDKELKRLFDPSFNPKNSAILEKKSGISLDKNIGVNNVVINNYRENKISITANSSSNTFLVLLDNYYPGWKAFVNNKEVSIYKTNYTFRGIFLPKGENKVEFIYDPSSFKLGTIASLFSLSVLLLLVVIRIKFSSPNSPQAKNKK